MGDRELWERMLRAWIGVNGMLKDSRITRELTYNEAVIMKLVYDQYQADGIGCTAVSEIVRETNMLKSLVNRTVNALCGKGYLIRERSGKDARSVVVRPVEARLPDFLTVHRRSLSLVRQIIGIVGPEDAACFIRMYEKLSAAGIRL
ncbi:MAG: hypothetical protein HFG10_03400 [Oscillibacter sp.]|jgi:DNA-binding MarR family transcriptional regulator|nr:hypothetical protein [Oscillibacter sp.]